MMGFNQLNDSAWLIRVAMLLSFSLQVILTFVAPMRKHSSHPLPRFAVWSSYLLAVWVAVLAVGLLLYNRCSSIGSSSIFAFWTPFLLLHLGGPDTITAYSLDDNELWLRHLAGMLFVLFSALLVFFCSVESNPVIIATVLVFVVGVIKYGERIYSLYSGSVRGFRDKILDEPNPGPNYAKLMTEYDSKKKAGLLVEVIIADGEASKAKELLEQGEEVQLVKNSKKSLEVMAYEFFAMFRLLFVNLILSYKERRISQAYFLDGEDMTAAATFEVVEVELGFLYDMVYTKAAVSCTKRGCVLRFVGTACLVAAVVLFVRLDKAGIRPIDRAITCALLLGGLALDVAAYLMLLSSNRMLDFLGSKPKRGWLVRVASVVRLPTRRWSERISKLNLISYSLGKAEDDTGRRCWCCRWTTIPSIMRCLIRAADLVGMREILDDFFFIRREPVSCRQTKEIDKKNKKEEEHSKEEKPINVLKYVFDGLTKAANEAKYSNYSEMKELCSHRGEGILNELVGDIQVDLTRATRLELNVNEEEQEEEENRELNFREVDFSYGRREAQDRERKACVAVEKAVKEKLDDVLRDSVRREFDESLLLWHGFMSISETLSEYMLYLLVRRPEMLPARAAGVGLLRYRDTCAEARRFFRSAAAWEPGHDDARRMLIAVNTSKKPAVVKGDRSKSVLFDACILAKVLLQLSDDTMWRVVAGVWREMLAYAAGKCHASTHVRQLTRGGELVTMVWFLLSHMGFGHMYRIQEGDANAILVVIDQ
ncbi:hypothetical protein E2562_036994 [Oryza meyeriana var. granulata]|uniref:DUF4220 domain-containing protein n=1 Tax=Oryza meyeriana var. granulata TaxID=110450 RepID=A0A6G1F1Y2_9ORYZ|nr:hypothetical protein E2562_036994 [Oryza meyeriana var. granulata]